MQQRTVARVWLTLALLWSYSSQASTSQEPDPVDAWQGAALAAPWQHYLQQSEQQRQLDQTTLAAECQSGQALIPAPSHRQSGLPYPEQAALLPAILSYQTPSGGWGKRTDLTQPRQPCQQYGHEPLYAPTLDNNASFEPMRYLMALYPSVSASQQAHISLALNNALQYLLKAQYPNGGFPQTFPLRGGYHDAITLNDDAMLQALELLRDISRKPDLPMFAKEAKALAAAGYWRGLMNLWDAQFKVGERYTIWPAQYHPLTLQPVAARRFEPASLVSSESAKVARLLLDEYRYQRKHPQTGFDEPQWRARLSDTANWLAQHAVRDQRWDRSPLKLQQPSQLVPAKGEWIWPRFFALTPDAQGVFAPVWFDRDGLPHPSVSALSLERQQGYGWYQPQPLSYLRAWCKVIGGAAWCAQLPKSR